MADTMLMLAQRYPSVEHWQIGNEPKISAYALSSFAGVYAKVMQAVVDAFAAKKLAHKLALAGMAYYH